MEEEDFLLPWLSEYTAFRRRGKGKDEIIRIRKISGAIFLAYVGGSVLVFRCRDRHLLREFNGVGVFSVGHILHPLNYQIMLIPDHTTATATRGPPHSRNVFDEITSFMVCDLPGEWDEGEESGGRYGVVTRIHDRREQVSKLQVSWKTCVGISIYVPHFVSASIPSSTTVTTAAGNESRLLSLANSSSRKRTRIDFANQHNSNDFKGHDATFEFSSSSSSSTTERQRESSFKADNTAEKMQKGVLDALHTQLARMRAHCDSLRSTLMSRRCTLSAICDMLASALKHPRSTLYWCPQQRGLENNGAPSVSLSVASVVRTRLTLEDILRPVYHHQPSHLPRATQQQMPLGREYHRKLRLLDSAYCTVPGSWCIVLFCRVFNGDCADVHDVSITVGNVRGGSVSTVSSWAPIVLCDEEVWLTALVTLSPSSFLPHHPTHSRSSSSSAYGGTLLRDSRLEAHLKIRLVHDRVFASVSGLVTVDLEDIVSGTATSLPPQDSSETLFRRGVSRSARESDQRFRQRGGCSVAEYCTPHLRSQSKPLSGMDDSGPRAVTERSIEEVLTCWAACAKGCSATVSPSFSMTDDSKTNAVTATAAVPRRVRVYSSVSSISLALVCAVKSQSESMFTVGNYVQYLKKRLRSSAPSFISIVGEEEGKCAVHNSISSPLTHNLTAIKSFLPEIALLRKSSPIHLLIGHSHNDQQDGQMEGKSDSSDTKMHEADVCESGNGSMQDGIASAAVYTAEGTASLRVLCTSSVTGMDESLALLTAAVETAGQAVGMVGGDAGDALSDMASLIENADSSSTLSALRDAACALRDELRALAVVYAEQRAAAARTTTRAGTKNSNDNVNCPQGKEEQQQWPVWEVGESNSSDGVTNYTNAITAVRLAPDLIVPVGPMARSILLKQRQTDLAVMQLMGMVK